MTVVARPRPAAHDPPGSWGLAALVLAGAGVIAANWLAVATDSDPGGVLFSIGILVVPALVLQLGAAIRETE